MRTRSLLVLLPTARASAMKAEPNPPASGAACPHDEGALEAFPVGWD